MTKEENELYGGSFFLKLGKDHHQDLYEHNLKYNDIDIMIRTFITRRRRNV